MNHLERLKGVFVADSKQRFYGSIPNDHVNPPITEGDFEPDASYLRFWLNDMYLAHKRVLYQTRCPVVQATCRFTYANSMQDLHLIVGPGQSEKLSAALDRMINLNYPLFGPVPYRGGDVELLIALVAMEVTDYSDMLVDVLGLLSQLAGRGELKAALPFIQPLKRGIEGLFGMQKLKIHLGVHDSFTSNTSAPNCLKSGYRVVIDIAHNNIDPATLWVKDGRLYEGSNPQAINPYNKADYFLFSLEKSSTRGDDMPSVRDAWDATIKQATQSNDQEVDQALSAFKAVVLNSPDLIWNDQQARIQTMVDRLKTIRTLMGRRGFVQSNFNTSLASALDEWQELVSHSDGKKRQLTRDELIHLNWR